MAKNKSISAGDFNIHFIGKDDDYINCPKQILIAFELENGPKILKGTKALFDYGDHAVIMDYRTFRDLIVKGAQLLAGCDSEFADILRDDDPDDEEKKYENAS